MCNPLYTIKANGKVWAVLDTYSRLFARIAGVQTLISVLHFKSMYAEGVVKHGERTIQNLQNSLTHRRKESRTAEFYSRVTIGSGENRHGANVAP